MHIMNLRVWKIYEARGSVNNLVRYGIEDPKIGDYKHDLVRHGGDSLPSPVQRYVTRTVYRNPIGYSVATNDGSVT